MNCKMWDIFSSQSMCPRSSSIHWAHCVFRDALYCRPRMQSTNDANDARHRKSYLCRNKHLRGGDVSRSRRMRVWERHDSSPLLSVDIVCSTCKCPIPLDSNQG